MVRSIAVNIASCSVCETEITISTSKSLPQISQRYTAWINYRQSRTGHVFQGRYKVLLIDADSCLLELVHYVHLNGLCGA